MDDIIQILIWLFIIYNIVASSMQNKKKKKAASHNFNESGTTESVAKKKSKDSRNADFIDFFGMKIPLQEEKEEDLTTEEIPAEKDNETWNPEENFTKNAQNKIPQPPIDENKPQMSALEKKKTEEMLEMIAEAEKSGQSAEENLLSEPERAEEKSVNARRSKYSKFLREKNELRRAVILSEILNKPKALRKYG